MNLTRSAPSLETGHAASDGPDAGPARRIRFKQGNHSDFYRTVRQRAAHYFEESGRGRYGDSTIALKATAYFALAAGAYALVLTGGLGPWSMLALANVYGIGALLLAVNVAHDAAHNALTPSRRLNRIIMTLCFTLVGADAYLWQMRHVKSHHTFPNVNGCDIDIDSGVFLRLSPNHPRHSYQRLQHWYAPLVFWLVDIHTVFIQDFHYLFKRRLANMDNIRHRASAYVQFLACKACYVSIIFVVPSLVLSVPWWHVIIGGLVMSFVSSCVFVYLLIGTHFAEETAFPVVEADGTIGHDWAVHAMITSLDWSPESRLAHVIAGGANAHAAHHLFPHVSHVHYVNLTRIIAATAAEFGIPHHVTTLPRMVRSHFRFLRAMGASPISQ